MKTTLDKKGFTLIEIIVAAAILSLSLFAVVAMVRKAQELSMLERHRRVAHGIINTMTESVNFQRLNYPNLATGQYSTASVTIDSKLSLTGTFTITVAAPATLTGTNGIQIPYRTITFIVTWNEPGAGGTSVAETVEIDRCVSP